MKRFLTSSVLAGALWLFPAVGNASTISQFSFSNSGSWAGSTTGTGTATVNFTDLLIGSTDLKGTGVTFIETYSWSGNVGTLTFKTGATGVTVGGLSLLANETFLTIHETGPDLVIPPGSAPANFSLYSGVQSLNLTSDFATDLGFSTTTPSTVYLEGSVGISDLTTLGTVSSATALFTITPEPASFTMLGMALLAGVGVSARKKLKLNRSKI